jgi:hypothetical protein
LAEDLAVARRPVALLLSTVICLIFFVAEVSAASARTSVLADLEVDEPVDGDVVVFGADLVLAPGARVSGDAVSIGGDIRVSEGAEVVRHVVSVLGSAEVPEGAEVGGKVLSLESLANLGPVSSTRGVSLRADPSMHLLTAGGWLLVTTGLAFGFPVRMRYGSWSLQRLGLKVPALGIMVGLTVVAFLIAALGLGPALGVPVVAALMIVAFAAKAVGLTVLGCWVGSALLRRWIHHPLPISLEVFVGVLVLLGLRFLPVAGATLWTLISLIAFGASIAFIGVSTDLVGPGTANANQ